VQRQGYGSRALEILAEWCDQSAGEVESALTKSTEATDSLLTEELQPRGSQALLTALDSCLPEYDIDYLGTSFGITLELYNFWKKIGYSPVYLRQQVQGTTGEHSLIMLKALDKSKDNLNLDIFVQDFRRRFMRTASGTFRHLSTTLSLSLLDSDGTGNILTLETLLEHFTRHDLQRIERYSSNKADMGLILDLIPQIALLYFQRRMDLTPSLTGMQAATFLTLGIQNRTIEDLAKEFSVDAPKIRALFQKALKRTWDFFYALLSSEVADEVAEAAVKTDIGGDSVVTTLAEEQRRAGREFKEGNIVSIKRDAEDVVTEERKKKKKQRKLHH